MKTETMKFPIPNEVLEPYIKQAVATSIIGALGDGKELIEKAVHAALNQKVGYDGNRNNYKNDYPLVQVLARKKIEEIAQQTINEIAEQMRPEIQREMEKQFSENESRIVRAMVDGLIGGLYSRWSVKLELKE